MVQTYASERKYDLRHIYGASPVSLPGREHQLQLRAHKVERISLAFFKRLRSLTRRKFDIEAMHEAGDDLSKLHEG